MTVQEIIAARSPGTTIDARVINLISLAELRTGTIYGSSRNDAVALMTLHWLALEARNAGESGTGSSPAGSLKSEKEGDLSRSYGSAGGNSSEGAGASDLSQTFWGLQLLSLRSGSIMGPMNRRVTF